MACIRRNSPDRAELAERLRCPSPAPSAPRRSPPSGPGRAAAPLHADAKLGASSSFKMKQFQVLPLSERGEDRGALGDDRV